jgi:Asp-tRNA(Asn)/Glu-tRNA(Gln) amidotransferase A subunit family amidase
MDLQYLGLFDIAERIRRREVTAETVTRLLLERIDRHEGRLHSIAYLLGDSALEQARRADREIGTGLYRGPASNPRGGESVDMALFTWLRAWII